MTEFIVELVGAVSLLGFVTWIFCRDTGRSGYTEALNRHRKSEQMRIEAERNAEKVYRDALEKVGLR